MLMSSPRVQTVIADPFRFAEDGENIRGEVAVDSLPRLFDLLENREGTLRYCVAGVQNPDGRPRLILTVEGSLSLRCQRCLGGVRWKADVRSELEPYRSGQVIPDEELENDEVDAFETEGELDVVALIEDEILLSMPIAPRHETCRPPEPGGGNEKQSPFAVLSRLKDNKT